MGNSEQQQDGAREFGTSEGCRLPGVLRAPILIVDDHPHNLIAFQAALEGPRHELVAVASGQEALDAAKHREFAAILLDVRMPGLSGYDTAALLRRRPKTKSTPILFTTAFDASAQEVSEAYSVGGTDFIQKPVDEAILRKKVGVFVDVYFDRLEAREWAKDLSESADRRLRLVFEQMPVNLCTVNRDLRITFADGLHIRTHGRAGGEIVGRNVIDFASHEDRGKVEKAFRGALEGRSTSYETRFDGVTFSAHVQPLYNREKAIVGAICGFMDVTAQKAAERKALERESVLEAFFRATSDMAFAKDASGRYLLLNEAGARTFGKEVGDVVGKADREILPEQAAEACRKGDEAVLKSGEPRVTLEEVSMPNEGTHLFRVSKAPLRDPSGNVTGVVGIAHDVTDLVRAREELQRSEERYRLAVGMTNEVIWDWDSRSDQVTWAGAVEILEPGAGKLLAWPLGKALERWTERIHPDDRERAVGAFRAILAGGAGGYLEEYRFRRADGRFGWFLDRANVYRDGEGKVVRIVGAMLDVTARKEAELRLRVERLGYESELARLYAEARRELDERRKAERSLRESEERFRSLSASSPVGVFTADTYGLYTYSNRRCQEILGASEQEVLGQGWARFVRPEDRGRALTGWVRAVSTGSEYSDTLALGSGDAARRLAQVRATPMFGDDSRVLGYVGTLEDVTDRVLREEAARETQRELEERVRERTKQLQDALEVLDSFARSAAHDLRSPLRAITNYLSILEEGPGAALGAEALQCLRGAIQSAERLDRYVGDLLDLSRVERQEITLRAVDPESVLREALVGLGPAITARGAEVRLEGPFPQVLGDPTLLGQVLKNLLANAIKFVPPDETPKVVVGGRQADDVIRIFVRDNGIGVPPAERERLYKAFERISSEYRYEGTGLGLAAVRRAADRMSGKVGMEAGPGGKGSEFWIDLPRA